MSLLKLKMALRRLITCALAGIDYLVHPQILGEIEETVIGDSLIPVLVLGESELNAGPVELRKTLDRFVDQDDVCTDDFTSILVVKPSNDSAVVHLDQTSHITTLFKAVHRLERDSHAAGPGQELPSGPYFLSGRSLHQAWRLYPDHLKSFVFGMIPDDVYQPTEYHSISVLTQDGTSLGIPVPSRHYHRKDDDRPLAGRRVGLKDIVDVKGVKTTVSSRAFSELYPEREVHALFTKHLIDTGAVIVGKTKTGQFATATLWIDFHRPRNARGDLYQDPSGSSTGAASALAGYEWLDHSIGGDSSGSVREPSTWHGLFGIRPTFGSASLDGVAINSPRYDTIGMFGRSLTDLYTISNATLNLGADAGNKAKRLLYPSDFYPVEPREYQDLTEHFVSAVEKSLGLERTVINLGEIWAKHPPEEASGASMQQYMDKAPFLSLCYDYSRQYKPFVDEYRERFDRDPFIEDSPRFRWGIGANITDDEYNEHLGRISVFKAWFFSKIMGPSGPMADSVMVLPYGVYEPGYSDVPYGPPLVFEGINSKLLAPILGTPHVVAPFAQAPYMSRISGREEYRPICGTLMTSPGNDLMLIRTMHETFQANKWRDFVDTGRFTFPLGDNARNVDDDEGYSH